MKVAAAVEAEVRPKVVEADWVVGVEAKLVVAPDAVAAEPMLALVVSGILAESV